MVVCHTVTAGRVLKPESRQHVCAGAAWCVQYNALYGNCSGEWGERRTITRQRRTYRAQTLDTRQYYATLWIRII